MSQDNGQARWQAIWQSRSGVAPALLPLAWLYGRISSARRWLYIKGWKSIDQLPVPVIVVGNVVVGGAGKTPTVLALVLHLQSKGWRPGVVSRGYGRQGTLPLEVLPDTPASECGDEPALIRRQTGLPVFVARQRAQAARALLARHPEVNLIVCDDGLQHLALGRDLSIAVFDDRGVGNGWLLPAGLLREPWPAHEGSPFSPDLVLHQTSQLHPAHQASATSLPTFFAQRSLAPVAVNALGEQQALTTLAHAQPTAVAGIARPDAFFNMLKAAGLKPRHTTALPDHADSALYGDLLKHHKGTLICTEKDAVKLFELARSQGQTTAARTWAVPLVLQIDPAFFLAVDQHLEPHRRIRPSA
ncbi:tetraacyldisaccharide 4'-kinase [Hydrogenophaga crassostreae]|nr:tetraacyldisaccharide 4'-kinase [Hydrogenophaga crassostreae]